LPFMIFQGMHGMRIVKGVQKIWSKVGDIGIKRRLEQGVKCRTNIVLNHKKILQKYPKEHAALCVACNKDTTTFFMYQNTIKRTQDKENRQWLRKHYAFDRKLLLQYTLAFDMIQQEQEGMPLFDGLVDDYTVAAIEGVIGSFKYTKSEKEKFIGPILTDESFQENKEYNVGKDIYEFSRKILELGIEVDKLSCEKALSLAIKHNNVFTAEAIIKHLLSVIKERQEIWPERLLACSIVEIATQKNEEMASVFFDCGIKRDNSYVSDS